MDISVIWLNFNEGSPNHGYWCFGWLEETLANVVEGQEPHVFYWGNRIDDYEHTPEEGAIVVIPAEYNAKHVDKINLALAKLPWCVLILASDEAGLFPVELLDMTNISALWVMTPHFEKHVYPPKTNFLPEFCPQDARERIAKFKSLGFQRRYPVSFSGQITHPTRYDLAKWMDDENMYINKTAGFAQGLDRDDYYKLLVETQVTPAPSGPVTLDSFRAFESLESGGIPILDTQCPVVQDGDLYWNSVLGEQHPLPTVRSWRYASTAVDDIDDNWPLSSNLVFSWWQMYKREVRYRILDGIPGITHGEMTILIPTSVIPSHPSTAILDETIASVRFHFPYADILVLCDGIRPEQEHRREDYDRYVQEVCWKANFEWHRVYPIVFGGHEHQANMTRVALDYVKTPLIMFVEHDTPLVTDEPIDWDHIVPLMAGNDWHLDVLRFHFESGIHPEHEHLMTDHGTYMLHGVPIRRTMQWSQRPHVAKKSWYQWMINEYFPPSGRTMIEDRIHGAAQDRPDLFQIAIYHPETGNIKRSLHTDGRGDDEKFPMVYE